MATDGQLQAELLSVYRELSRLYKNRDQLLNVAVETEKERDKALADNLQLEAKLASSRKFWYEVDEQNAQLTIRNQALEDALNVCLDLVGEVINQEAMLDQLAFDTSQWKMGESLPFTHKVGEAVLDKAMVHFVDVVPGVMPEAYDESSPRGAVMPLLCLSCNAPKEGFYLCEECFEIDLDHSCDVFEELQLAWDKGERDFPRPDKNIKVLYAK